MAGVELETSEARFGVAEVRNASRIKSEVKTKVRRKLQRERRALELKREKERYRLARLQRK